MVLSRKPCAGLPADALLPFVSTKSGPLVLEPDAGEEEGEGEEPESKHGPQTDLRRL
jgi:hypothetical protein